MVAAQRPTYADKRFVNYSYGCHNLYNEAGTRYILNSQISSAEALLYKNYDCSNLAATIPHLDYWHGDISPICSILLTP